MIAKILVHFYLFVHGTLGLPGAGWLVRRFVPWVTGLHAYPFRVSGVGVAIIDFRDAAAFGLLNASLGERGQNTHLIEFIESFLKPDMVFWDVGANVGYLSLDIVRHHPELQAVHLFEPNPTPLKSLNSLFSDHPKVIVHPVGLGRRNEELHLSTERLGTPTGSLVRKFEDGQQVKVVIRQGDQYREEERIPPPDVLKIDVEGFEPEVLAGLTETIRQHRPVIFIEHHFLEDVQLRALLPPGYRTYFIMPTGKVTMEWSTRYQSSDAILVPQEREHAKLLG